MDAVRDPGTGARGLLRRPGATFSLLVTCFVGLLAIAVLSLALTGQRAVDLPRDTPAGTIQAYLRAYQSGDLDTAYQAFSARVRRQLSFSSFADDATGWAADELGRQPVALGRVDEYPDRATVHLRIGGAGDPGLLDGGQDTWEMTVRLVHEGGAWRIDQPLAGLTSLDYYR
jgi:hypothetical protein